MIATGVITPFLIPMKIAAMAAFLVALPYVLYQAWAFVAPGLYAHEKRLVLPLVVSSTLLFFAGMAFCYFVVFRKVFDFISSFAPKSVSVAPTSRPTSISCSACSSPSGSRSRCPWWSSCWCSRGSSRSSSCASSAAT
jgi:Tat protein translocase TatC